MAENEKQKKVEPKDLHDLMWKCRNLEIDNLWKRSTLLATFLVIFWTGLGYSFYKYIDLRLDNEKLFVLRSSIGNFFLLGIQVYAMLGSFISLLWICMTKGSKAWVEFFEGHIDSLVSEESRVLYFSEELVRELEKCGDCFPYNGYYPKDFSRKWSNCILKTDGGTFSPSRINIVIGVVSFLLFSLIEVFMFYFVLANTFCSYIPLISVLVLLLYVGGTFRLYKKVKSGFLEDIKRQMCN